MVHRLEYSRAAERELAERGDGNLLNRSIRDFIIIASTGSFSHMIAAGKSQ